VCPSPTSIPTIPRLGLSALSAGRHGCCVGRGSSARLGKLGFGSGTVSTRRPSRDLLALPSMRITQTKVLLLPIPFTSKALVIWTDEPTPEALEWNVGPMFGYDQIVREISKSALRDLSVEYTRKLLDEP